MWSLFITSCAIECTCGNWAEAHDPGGVVQGHVVVQRRIDGPRAKAQGSLFITSCAIECTCGNWASTFLVEYKHVPAERAARIVMFSAAVMAVLTAATLLVPRSRMTLALTMLETTVPQQMVTLTKLAQEMGR